MGKKEEIENKYGLYLDSIVEVEDVISDLQNYRDELENE